MSNDMAYTDKPIICRDCGREFVFTAGEQEFYSQKGFLNDPVRCPECRRARKQARDQGAQRESRSQGTPQAGVGSKQPIK
jgi:ssDNA-binding Zn-finger/Zn-ribbon topoisomerase 1